jgi:transposase-like protein
MFARRAGPPENIVMLAVCRFLSLLKNTQRPDKIRPNRKNMNVTNPGLDSARPGHFSEEVLSNPLVARLEVERLRWPDGVFCPKCGSVGKSWPVQSRGQQKGDDSRRRLGARPGVWKCALCRQQFTVTVGTVLEDTKLSLDCWLRLVTILCLRPQGARLQDLADALEISMRTSCKVQNRVMTTRHQQPLLSVWRRAIASRRRGRGQFHDSNRLALDSLWAVARVPASQVLLQPTKDRPVTLWPLTPREAMTALLLVRPQPLAIWE